MEESPNWERNIIKPTFSSAIMKVLSETAPTSCFIGANGNPSFLSQIKWLHEDFISSRTGGTTSHLLTPQYITSPNSSQIQSTLCSSRSVGQNQPQICQQRVCEKCRLFKPHSSCGIGGHGASISLVFSLNRVAHIFPGLYVSTRLGSRPTQDTPSNSNVFSSPPDFR